MLEADEQPAISLPAEACYPELQLFRVLPACPATHRCGAKDARAGSTRDASSPVPTAGKRCKC